MPGLLDYLIRGYQGGGGVDFDPYSSPTQAELLQQMGITVDTGAMGLLPTYDTTGQEMMQEAYNLRGQGLTSALGQARAGGTQSLLDLQRQATGQQAGAGFAGAGAGVRAAGDVRENIVRGFGEAAGDIGRQREQSYLDLQRDVWGAQQAYERELTSAIGDLDPESWRFSSSGSSGGTCNEQCAHLQGEQRDICWDECQGGQTEDEGQNYGTYRTCNQQGRCGYAECTNPNGCQDECSDDNECLA